MTTRANTVAQDETTRCQSCRDIIEIGEMIEWELEPDGPVPYCEECAE
jgi:hypothetical protein